MGLFSKKTKTVEYDAKDCEIKKKRMREIFNETVCDGDTYEILYAFIQHRNMSKVLCLIQTQLHFSFI